jgi:hypothetical protein
MFDPMMRKIAPSAIPAFGSPGKMPLAAFTTLEITGVWAAAIPAVKAIEQQSKAGFIEPPLDLVVLGLGSSKVSSFCLSFPSLRCRPHGGWASLSANATFAGKFSHGVI